MTAAFDRRKFLTAGALALAAHTRIARALGAGEAKKTGPEAPAGAVYPGSKDYDRRRSGYNLRVSSLPGIIVPCANTGEVAAAIRYARARNLAVAVKSGGHSFEGFSSNDDGMVVDLSAMNGVEWIDTENVRVGPGCLLSQLYDVILPKGRLIPAGSCGGVGIAGLTLGGGYGLFGRAFGLTCDSLTGVTMVDGRGRIVLSEDFPELLHACRGGGNGNFGVITELRFRTHPMPPSLRGHRFKTGRLDVARAASILERWFDIAARLPVTAFSAYVLNGPFLTILVTDTGDPAGPVATALAELKAITDRYDPGVETPTAKAIRNYYGRAQPLWFKNASAGFLRGYRDIAGAAIPALAKVIGTPGMIWQVNTLGGKISDKTAAAVSCFAHRDKPFLAELQAYPRKPADRAGLVVRFAEIQKLFRDGGVAAHYANYPDLGFENWETAYYGESRPSLRKLKLRFDPDNRIRHRQSVPAAE